MRNPLLKLGSLFGAASIVFASGAPAQVSANEASPVTTGITAPCAATSREAAVLSASPADVSDLAVLQDPTATAYIQVDLAPSGALRRASILKSTGNRMLDLSALRAARWTSFRAEIRDCRAVAGSYLFVVSFDR